MTVKHWKPNKDGLLEIHETDSGPWDNGTKSEMNAITDEYFEFSWRELDGFFYEDEGTVREAIGYIEGLANYAVLEAALKLTTIEAEDVVDPVFMERYKIVTF